MIRNQRIEADIGRQPDGLAVACLDQATNATSERKRAKPGSTLLPSTLSATTRSPLSAKKSSEQDGYDLGDFRESCGKGKIAILAGSLTALDHVQRITGFKRALAEHPDMTIVFEQPDDDIL